MNFVCTPDEPRLSLDPRRLVPRQLRAFLVIIQRCAHEKEDTEENKDGTVTYFPEKDVVEGLVLVPNPDSLTVFEKLGTLGNDRVEKTLAEHRAAETRVITLIRSNHVPIYRRNFEKTRVLGTYMPICLHGSSLSRMLCPSSPLIFTPRC